MSPAGRHSAAADVAALLTGTHGTLVPEHARSDVVVLDGTGVRAGDNRLGITAFVTAGLTGRSRPGGVAVVHTHLLWPTGDVGRERWPRGRSC